MNRTANDKTSPETHCLYKEIVRVLGEEPRLEAVALRGDKKEISLATLGEDEGGRLRKRVEEIVAAESSHCGRLDAGGVCSCCGKQPAIGAERIVIKQFLGDTLIEKTTCPTAVSFWRWVSMRWPQYVPRESSLTEHEEGEWKLIAWLAAGCLVFGLSGWAIDSWFHLPWLALLAYLAAYVCGGWDAACDAWEKVRKFQLDIHFLMLAVAVGAAAVGAWKEGSLLLFLFTASGAMEHYAMGRTRKEISALLDAAPKTARVLDETGERILPVDQLVEGMLVRVISGEQVPADMRVTKGESACDESNLTGEARPVPKACGDTALAGTMNLLGVFEGEVLRPASESALQKIIGLIEKAQGMKAPSQRFTDRFGTGYTWTILLLCSTMFFVWWLVFGLPPFDNTGEQESALYRAMTLLVVASPCALVLSVPSSILSAIASGARRGILFRGGAAVENFAKVKVVAFDKTGTLTSGELGLTEICCFRGEETALKKIAASFAKLSQHPLSRSLATHAETWGIDIPEVENLENVLGRGLVGKIGETTYRMGNARFVQELAGETAPPSSKKEEFLGAEVWVAGEDVFGVFRFSDKVRPESKKTLAALRKHGIRTVMLTGDRKETAVSIGNLLGVDEVRAELMPEGKVSALQELKENGTRKVAMVGDGVNDAPCIAAADVGIAMGARGSDAALEQAEVVLMNDHLENVLLALELSEKSKNIIYQNVALALGTITVMGLTTFIYPIPLAFGVFAHEGSTVLVVLNSLRLLAVRLK